METSNSNTQAMKPSFLKAAIPLALSIAGFVSAKLIFKRYEVSDKSNICSLDSNEESRDNDHQSINYLASSSTKDDHQTMIKGLNSGSEEDLLGLRSRIEEVEMRFLGYQEMKEQELLLMELQNKWVLESAHIESMCREISSMEAENQRFQNLVVSYIRVLEQIEAVKLQNGFLRRKAKRVLKRLKEQKRIIREKKMKIEEAEAEILRVVETKCDVIKKLEDEVRNLHMIVDRLQVEKNELLIKLNDAQNSALSTTKIEADYVTIEDYNQLINELEQVRQDRANETSEITYLKWINACLKHELMRTQEHEEINEKKENSNFEAEQRTEINNCEFEHHEKGEVCLNLVSDNHEHDDHVNYSRRRRFFSKLKKWVEGGSDHHNRMMKSRFDDKATQEIKCFRRFPVSDEIEDYDHMVLARRSCSSA